MFLKFHNLSAVMLRAWLTVFSSIQRFTNPIWLVVYTCIWLVYQSINAKHEKPLGNTFSVIVTFDNPEVVDSCLALEDVIIDLRRNYRNSLSHDWASLQHNFQRLDFSPTLFVTFTYQNKPVPTCESPYENTTLCASPYQ